MTSQTTVTYRMLATAWPLPDAKQSSVKRRVLKSVPHKGPSSVRFLTAGSGAERGPVCCPEPPGLR